MKANLILCVKNGGARLQTCLEHIGRLEGPGDLEVLLVDNSSTDGSMAMLQAFAERCKFSCKLLQSLIPGNGAGRNRAIEQASGDVLLFIDADCYVEPDFARAWLGVFAAQDIGFASGRIMRFNPAHSMLGCNEDRGESRFAPRGFVPRGFIQGSNMAFSRTCLAKAGLFDERFGAGTSFAGEEWELALRASFTGFAGGCFSAPGVAHDHGRMDDVARERLLFYDYGAGAVYAKHILRPAIMKKYFGEMFRMRNDRQRMRVFLRGVADYWQPSSPSPTWGEGKGEA